MAVEKVIKEKAESSILLEQYKLIVNSVEGIRTRRQTFNNIFSSVYIGILGAYGFFSKTPVPDKLLIVSIMIIGLLLTTAWIGIVKSTYTTEIALVKEIQNLEKDLPAKIFTTIWGVKKEKKHLTLEVILPGLMWIFLAANLIAFFIM